MTVQQFRLRGSIEAVQWTGHNEPELVAFTGGRFEAVDPEDRGDDPGATGSVLDRHSSWVGVHPGDWIYKGAEGELYRCEPDLFKTTYEPVAPEDDTPDPAETPHPYQPNPIDPPGAQFCLVCHGTHMHWTHGDGGSPDLETTP